MKFFIIKKKWYTLGGTLSNEKRGYRIYKKGCEKENSFVKESWCFFGWEPGFERSVTLGNRGIRFDTWFRGKEDVHEAMEGLNGTK